MTRRELLPVCLLTLFTCGLYGLYWQFKTTEELKLATGKADLNPGLELLLTFITCGLFGIYVHYRNAMTVTERMRALKGVHDDKSTLVLVLDLASLVVGFTWIAAVVVLQEEFNKLADASPPAGVQPMASQLTG